MKTVSALALICAAILMCLANAQNRATQPNEIANQILRTIEQTNRELTAAANTHIPRDQVIRKLKGVLEPQIKNLAVLTKKANRSSRT